MVKCRYCSSEISVKDEKDIIICPWCCRSFLLSSTEMPTTEEIYRARYDAEMERRKQFTQKHPPKPKLDRLRYRDPKVTVVKGIKITTLKRDNVYAQSFKTPMTLMEMVSHAANSILANPKGTRQHSRIFYSHVDIPDLKCSIILEAIYFGGLTVGYHELTDQLYIRPRGSCWQRFDIGG